MVVKGSPCHSCSTLARPESLEPAEDVTQEEMFKSLNLFHTFPPPSTAFPLVEPSMGLCSERVRNRAGFCLDSSSFASPQLLLALGAALGWTWDQPGWLLLALESPSKPSVPSKPRLCGAITV